MNQILLITAQLMIVFSIFTFGYFGFGLFLLKKLNLKVSLGEKLVLGTIVSISLLTALVAISGQFLSINAYYLLLPIFIVGASQYKEIFLSFKLLLSAIKKNIFGSLLILAISLLFTSTMIFGYFRTNGDLRLQEVHDSLWHLALVQNLQESIPPLHPSTDKVVLNNYHYFYDLFLSGIAKFSHISEFILYFQISVIFLSLSLVGSAFVLGKSFKDSFTGYLLVGVTILTGSISYLIPVFFHPDQPWGESSFWVSQTLVMIVNPQVIYTLTVTNLIVLLIKKLELIKKITKQNKKEYIGLHLLIIILSSTSIGFKSYAFVVLSFVYALVLLRELFKHKSSLPIGVGLVYSLFSLPLMWLITRFQGNSFFYEPLWFTNSMIESPDRVNYLEWKFLQDHYIFKKNWPRLWVLEAKKIAVFYFGNLGIRSLFIGLPILAVLKKYRKKINWVVVGYIFLGFLFSSIFPLLFLQRGTVWNSIQFWYYSLIFANILFVLLLSKLLENKSKLLIATILTVLLAAAIPTSIKTIQDKNRDPFVLEKEIVSTLAKLDSSDTLLLCPEGFPLYHSALVKVLTPANIYLANPSQLELVGSNESIAKDYEEIVASKNVLEFNKLIESENITNIVCSDKHMLNIFQEMLKDKEKNIEIKDIGDWKIINL